MSVCPVIGQRCPVRRLDARCTPKAGRSGLSTSAPHDRILEVVRELFCRDGIHATGIDRILAEASASKMALYSRFGSKEALLREVLAKEGEAQRKIIFGVIDAAGPDPVTQLHAVIPALRAWFESDRFYGCAFMNAAAEHTKGADSHPWLRALTKAHHAEILGRLEALAIAASYPEPSLLARQILLVMDGAIAALMVGDDATVLTISERNLRAVLVH